MRQFVVNHWPVILLALIYLNLLVWRANRRHATRPVAVQSVKRRKGKRRKQGVDRNGWPKEIIL